MQPKNFNYKSYYEIDTREHRPKDVRVQKYVFCTKKFLPLDLHCKRVRNRFFDSLFITGENLLKFF